MEFCNVLIPSLFHKLWEARKFGWVWIWTRLKLRVAINNVLIASVYCWIWRRCWGWLIFRQGSGLFCRTGPRGCIPLFFFFFNFESWMLTGNVCSPECIHMPQQISTMIQYQHWTERWRKRKDKREATENRRPAVAQMLLTNPFFNSAKEAFWQPPFVCLSAKWLKL